MSIDLRGWGDDVPQFVRLLANEAALTNMTRASQRIGMSRTTVSLVLANRYPSLSTAHVERRVMAALGSLQCPAQHDVISSEQCQGYRAKPAPTHNPHTMQYWQACQRCAHHPDRINQETDHARIH